MIDSLLYYIREYVALMNEELPMPFNLGCTLVVLCMMVGFAITPLIPAPALYAITVIAVAYHTLLWLWTNPKANKMLADREEERKSGLEDRDGWD